MSVRLTDMAVERVLAALGGLQVPQVVKDQIEWEVMPSMGRDGSLAYVPMIGLPVPNTADDFEMAIGAPGLDPHAPQAEWDRAVRLLVEQVQVQSAERAMRNASPQNGHKTSPGGLALP